MSRIEKIMFFACCFFSGREKKEKFAIWNFQRTSRRPRETAGWRLTIKHHARSFVQSAFQFAKNPAAQAAKPLSCKACLGNPAAKGKWW